MKRKSKLYYADEVDPASEDVSADMKRISSEKAKERQLSRKSIKLDADLYEAIAEGAEARSMKITAYIRHLVVTPTATPETTVTAPPEEIPTGKTCKKCHTTQDIKEFRRDPKSKDGLRGSCRACEKKYRDEKKSK